jgi:hypothetical protein
MSGDEDDPDANFAEATSSMALAQVSDRMMQPPARSGRKWIGLHKIGLFIVSPLLFVLSLTPLDAEMSVKVRRRVVVEEILAKAREQDDDRSCVACPKRRAGSEIERMI